MTGNEEVGHNTNEVLCHSKKSLVKGILCKLDFSKAFDESKKILSLFAYLLSWPPAQWWEIEKG